MRSISQPTTFDDVENLDDLISKLNLFFTDIYDRQLINIVYPSGFKATRATAQSIPNDTHTIVQYDTKSFDIASEYDEITNYRFTATRAGYYYVSASLLSASVAWDASEYWVLGIYKNESLYTWGYYNTGPAATQYRHSIINTVIQLEAGDYIDARVTHTQGGSVNVFANDKYNYFSVFKIG